MWYVLRSLLADFDLMLALFGHWVLSVFGCDVLLEIMAW